MDFLGLLSTRSLSSG